MIVVVAISLTTLQATGSFYRVKTFTMADGLAQEHFGDMVQDPTGYIWIGTWNGLARFDGYRFEMFQPSAKPTSTNRLLRLRIGTDGRLYCELTNHKIHVFDRRLCRFVATLNKPPKGWPLGGGFDYMRNVAVPDSIVQLYPTARLCSYDRQGNVWIKATRSLALATRHDRLFDYDTNCGSHSVRAILIDHHGRKWTGNKDGSLMVGGKYITADGKLSSAYSRLANIGIYTIREDANGRLLVGAKGDGLFVLTPNGSSEAYSIRHIVHESGNQKSISSNKIYDIALGHDGQIFVATWSGGIDILNSRMERTGNLLGQERAKVRCLLTSHDGTLIAGTTDGIVAVRGKRANRLLRGCDVMRTVVCGQRLYAAVYGVGLCKMALGEIMSPSPRVTRYPTPANTYASAMETATATPDHVWIFSKSCIARFSVSSEAYSVYDSDRLGQQFYFTEAAPALLLGGDIAVGTEQGCLTFVPKRLQRRMTHPRIVVTGVQYQGSSTTTVVDDIDTLHIKPNQRSVMLYVSTLHFAHTEKTGYKYRMDGVDGDWNYAMRSNAISYSGLRPGKHTLRIRSCDDEGVWLDNERCIVVDVKPLFHETLWFCLLMVLLAVAVVAAIVYTWTYIKRLHRRQRELEDYCHSLLTAKETDQTQKATPRSEPPTDSEDKAFLEKFMALFRANIANGDMSVQDYADSMAMSRTVFYRRIKTLTGCTPVELIGRLRLQAAATLFDEGERQVADVAYRTGFSDPKYFSKSFRKAMGMSPSEYIASRSGKD